MRTTRSNSSDADTQWPPSFRTGIWPAAGFVLAFALWALISVSTFTWLVGNEYSLVLESLWSVPSGLVQLGIVAAVYRYDGVTLAEVGLSTRLLRPAVIAVAGVLVVVNGVVVGMALFAGNEITFGVYALYQSAPFNLSWTGIVAVAVSSYVFVGPVEELAFRGYLQNKLVSLLTFGSLRARTATSVVLTGVIFSALHIPVQVLIYGTQISQLPGILVLLALSGMILGTIYALTQNLYLVIFLHGVGDFWPLFVDPGPGIWPNYFVLLLVYLGLIVVYRWSAKRTSVTPLSPLATE